MTECVITITITHLMSKERLQSLKGITTWSGVAITFSGILLNLASGGSWLGSGLSLLGLIVTCCGHWISNALGEHQKAEKAADEKRIAELEERARESQEFLQEFGDVVDDAPYLRKVIKAQRDEDFVRGFNGDDWK